jgi:NTE family protein
MKSKPVIGLALGSGSARGWSHIGIINALADLGISPNVICGTSIGSLVGAAYAANRMSKLEEWVCSLTRLETVRFFEINTSLAGFVNKERFQGFLHENVADKEISIEDLDKQYAAVATDLETGREIWLNQGPLLEAVWASISLPGLFPAIRNENRWLVDGGLVNPVPVSVCRAMGADIVIAVNLNGDIVGKYFDESKRKKADPPAKKDNNEFSSLIREYTDSLFSSFRDKEETPSLFDAIAGSLNIAQDRITRSRLAGDPPDIILSPRLSHIGLLEFYRGNEAIKEGKQCVKRMEAEIFHVLEHS